MNTDGLLTYIGPDGNLWLMRPDGSDKRTLTADATPDDGYDCPRWSPDGQSIVVVRPAAGALYVARSPAFIPCQVFRAWALLAGWGPGDGQLTVAAADQRAQAGTLLVLDGTDGVAELLRAGQWPRDEGSATVHPTTASLRIHSSALRWSDDGRYLAMIWPGLMAPAGSLLDAHAESLRALAPLLHDGGRGTRVTAAAFGTDNTLLAGVEAPGTSVAMLMGAGSAVPVRGGRGHAVTWAPDDRTIYYVCHPAASPSLWRVPSCGGIPEEVLEGRLALTAPMIYHGSLFWGLPSFSPSGAWFVVDQVQADGRFGTPAYQSIETIWLAELDGRRPRMLGMGRQVAWQPKIG